MNDKKKSFILYLDAMRLTKILPVEQRGWLITALTAFAWAVAEDLDADWEEIADAYPAMSEECRDFMQYMCSSIARDTGKWHSRREASIRRKKKLYEQEEEAQA